MKQKDTEKNKKREKVREVEKNRVCESEKN